MKDFCCEKINELLLLIILQKVSSRICDKVLNTPLQLSNLVVAVTLFILFVSLNIYEETANLVTFTEEILNGKLYF